MNCKECRDEIEIIERPQPLSRSADSHIEACAACRSFRDEQLALSQMIGSLEVVSAPADFDFRLRARLAALKSDGHRGFSWQRFAPGAWSLAIAASFVVMITAGLFIRQAWRTPSTTGDKVTAVQDTPSVVPSVPPKIVEAPTAPDRLVVRENVSPQALAYSRPNVRRSVRVRPDPVITNAVASDEGGGHIDSGVRPPPSSRTPPGIPDPVTQPGALVGLPVSASMKSAKVALDDGHVKPQFLSLRPVTFGAQEVIEEKAAQKYLVLGPQGIW